MAYGTVGTPRFYIDIPHYLREIGFEQLYDPTNYTDHYNFDRELFPREVFDLNPVTIYEKYFSTTENTNFNPYPYNFLIDRGQKLNYWAILNHNYGGLTIQPHFHRANRVYNEPQEWLDCLPNHTEIVNADGAYNSQTYTPRWNGFSITELTNSDTFQPTSKGHNKDDLISCHLYFDADLSGMGAGAPANSKLGCMSIGKYYDMPHSADLNLTMSREFGKIDEMTTINGPTVSNTMESKPKWGDLGAWELANHNTDYQDFSRKGRRVWNLTFSYIDQGDLYSSNELVGTIASKIGGTYMPKFSEVTHDYATQQAQLDSDDIVESQDSGFFKFNINDESSFFSEVWHKTLGGTLKFIFQPNNLDANPDQFCIAKFRNNSLKADRIAHNVYKVSLVIEEVW